MLYISFGFHIKIYYVKNPPWRKLNYSIVDESCWKIVKKQDTSFVNCNMSFDQIDFKTYFNCFLCFKILQLLAMMNYEHGNLFAILRGKKVLYKSIRHWIFLSFCSIFIFEINKINLLRESGVNKTLFKITWMFSYICFLSLISLEFHLIFKNFKGLGIWTRSLIIWPYFIIFYFFCIHPPHPVFSNLCQYIFNPRTFHHRFLKKIKPSSGRLVCQLFLK